MAMSGSGAGRDLRLGEILVREGLITEVELVEAMRWKTTTNTVMPLGQILIRNRVLTRQQLDVVLKRYQKHTKLGDVLVRSGTITPDQLSRALAQQKITGDRLGQTLVKLQYLTDDELRRAIAEHL